MNKIKATYTVIWWESSGILGKSNNDFDWKMAEESHRLTTLKKNKNYIIFQIKEIQALKK